MLMSFIKFFSFREGLLNNYIYNCTNEDKTNKNVISDKKNNNYSNMSMNAFELLCNFVKNFIK